MTRHFLGLMAIFGTPILAQAQLQAVRVTGTTNFNQPLFGTTAPGGNASLMYVVQKGGEIRTINTAAPGSAPQPFFNYTSVPGHSFNASGEGGLLGLAFHPNFASNRTFYTFSTADGGNNLRVDQFRTNVNGTVDYSSRLNVLTVAHPTFNNHNAGWIGFKPGDTQNNLYIATGDGGSGNDPGNNAQNTNSLLGKMLRVNVRDGITSAGGYEIPAGNMTINPNGNLNDPAPPSLTVRPEIFAYGLRNPFRSSFDRGSASGVGQGNLYIGDVGQDAREEINFIASNRVNTSTLDQNPGSQNGINFGWRLREGNIATPGVGSNQLRNDNVEPTISYVQDFGATPFFGNSVTGGYVYRGPAFADVNGTNGDLNGTYIFADFVNNQIGSFRTDPVTGLPIASTLTNRTSELTNSGAIINGIASFGEDGLGNLYYFNINDGHMWRIVPVPEPLFCLPLSLPLLWLARRRLKSTRDNQRTDESRPTE